MATHQRYVVRAAHNPPTVSSSPISISRRTINLMHILPLVVSSAQQLRPAHASGLLRYPITEQLNNQYYLVRAGESIAESQNMVLTNPVAKTSMTSALSELGKKQVLTETYQQIKDLGGCDGGCWFWPSMHSGSYQTAELLSQRFGVGRNRLVPEFSKLDMRAVGKLDRGELEAVAAIIKEGDSLASDWKPPNGQDGTPNESLEDVMVRGRELLSLLETQYLGDSIILVSPDSYNLSVLQAAVLGLDLRAHEQFSLLPGQVRKLEVNTNIQRDDSPRQIRCEHPPQCK